MTTQTNGKWTPIPDDDYPLDCPECLAGESRTTPLQSYEHRIAHYSGNHPERDPHHAPGQGRIDRGKLR